MCINHDLCTIADQRLLCGDIIAKVVWGGDRKFLKPLMRFTRGCPLVAHNAAFDRGFWLAEGYLRRGEPLRARALVEDILAASRGESRRAAGIGERLLGESLMSENHVAAAGHLDAAIAILEAIDASNELARALAARAELHRGTRDIAAAGKLLERALTIFEELGTLDEPPRVRVALATLGEDSTA